MLEKAGGIFWSALISIFEVMENNSKHVEEKFQGRRVNINKTQFFLFFKSIKVIFTFLGQFFAILSIFVCSFFARFWLRAKNTDNLEMWFSEC